MSSRLIHGVVCARIFFLFKTNILFYIYTTFCLAIHLLRDSCIAESLTSWLLQWSCYENGCTNISLRSYFQFFWYIPRNGIAGSYDNVIFKVLRKRHTDFHSSYTISDSYQQCTRVPDFPHLYQNVLFSVFVFM